MGAYLRVLGKPIGQVPLWLLHRQAKHNVNRPRLSSAFLRIFPPLRCSFSLRDARLFHMRDPGALTGYPDMMRERFFHHSCNQGPQLPTYYWGTSLRARPLSSTASVLKYFAEHELSAFREFSAGLNAFGRGSFVESSQQFSRLYEVIQQANQSRQFFSTTAQLLACGCLATALFRQCAYNRAEAVSMEMVTAMELGTQSTPDVLTRYEAYRAFATILAASAAFETEAQLRHKLTEEMQHHPACHHPKAPQRMQGKDIFFPMQTARSCVTYALRTYKAESMPRRTSDGISVLMLRILVESLGNAEPPSPQNLRKKPHWVSHEVNGVLYEFLKLMQMYNTFVLQIYAFLDASASNQETMEVPQEDNGSYVRTAAELLTDATAVLERFESKQQKGQPILCSNLVAPENAAAPCHGWRVGGTDEIPVEVSNVGTLCETIIEKDFAAQVVIGVAQLYKGVGSCLLRLSENEDHSILLQDNAADKDSLNGFSLGQTALKKGLTLCKRYATIGHSTIKGGLLATLAASFCCAGDAVVSEGLFCSALNEFAASTGLESETLIDAAEGKLCHPGKQTSLTARLNSECQLSKQDTGEPGIRTLKGCKLTFVDRFEYASAMLQYGSLLSRWDGREFEAKRIRRAAAMLSPVLSDNARDKGSMRQKLECRVFSLLWRPRVSIALCLTAGLSVNWNV